MRCTHVPSWPSLLAQQALSSPLQPPTVLFLGDVWPLRSTEVPASLAAVAPLGRSRRGQFPPQIWPSERRLPLRREGRPPFGFVPEWVQAPLIQEDASVRSSPRFRQVNGPARAA